MKPWTFVHVADMQPGSPRSYRYNPSWILNWREAREQILEVGPDLLLVGGDLTRDGSIHRFELEEMRDDLAGLPFPCRVVPGNMDTGNKHTRRPGCHRSPDQCDDLDLNVTSEQLQQFASVFGPLWWSFEHKGVRFSGLPDMVVNSGLPEEAALWAWAEAQAQRPPAEHHVWVLHSPLFVDALDEPDWDVTDRDQYDAWYFTIDQPGRARLHRLFLSTGATLVISGHVHCRRSRVVDGICYQISPSTAFGQWASRWPDGDASLGFLRYDVSAAGIRGTFVPLRKQHRLEGYGPGGHPAPHARNYSLAWQQGE